MEKSVRKAIEEITYKSKIFPEEQFRIISENKELALPYLYHALEKAVLEKEELEPDYELHFYALHLMAQFQERGSFPKIMEMASLPRDVLDGLIGDAVTSTLQDILYNTYNGDLELLKNAVKNPDIDEYARSSMLDVMGQLYLDGDLRKEELQDFSRRIVYDEDEIGEYIYIALVHVLCDCHMVEMLPEIRRLFEDGRIDTMGIGGYEEAVDMMFQHEGNICKTPVNAADMLRSWAMFQEEDQELFREKDIEKLFREIDAQYNRQEKKIKIGRNDPCPCGSGKKYKKCCLNRPKESVELIESEQEKKRCLQNYPASAKERKEGRIYLEDYFDPESIEIDKLLYLALVHRPGPIWRREPDEVVENRQRIYLSKAFSLFSEKIKKEKVNTFQEYDKTYSIHYQCAEWLEPLRILLKKSGDEELLEAVSEVCRKMERDCEW